METIGSYQILSQIGAGGMGAVFLAEHRFLRRRAAIKMLLADLVTRPDVLERFFAEARATSQLEHPGIVRIFDCEVDNQGRPYFVMEYLEGETLAAHLRRSGRLPFPEAVGYTLALADALGTAHARGIVHRDLKPDNIFVRPGPVPAIKLVDFGIAKLAEEFRAVAGSRTQTGTLLGTPPYMSPEQCRGAGNVDHRTDIYSLGCVLFEMLCGAPPFERDSTGAFLIAHITQAPPLAHDKNPEVPIELGLVIDAMLAKAPEARPQSMADLIPHLLPFAPPPPAPAVPISRPITGPVAPPPDNSAFGPAAFAGTQLGPHGPPVGANGHADTAPRTTLQSNAGELLDGGGAPGELPPARKRKVLAIGAALAFGVVGFTAWKLLPLWRRAPQAAVEQTATDEPTSAEAAPAATLAKKPARKNEPRAAVTKPDGKAEAKPAVPARGHAAAKPSAPTAAAKAPATPGPRAVSARARGTVIIDIESEPTGAFICFDGDPRIISATRRQVELPYADQQVAFLIDLPGYEPGRLVVRGNRDTYKVVKLRPMPAGQGRRPVCTY